MDGAAQVISSIAWPQAALLFALVFVILFFKPLRAFIDRIKSVGKEGVTTEGIPKAQIAETKKQAVEDLMRLGDSVLLREVEAAISADLKARDLETSSDSVKVLIHHLSATQIALEFEQVHSVIFGSQIFLLKKLNEYRDVGLDSGYVEKHFNHVQQLFPSAFGDWNVDKYLSFPLNRMLLRIDHGKYHITVRGAEFLTWLVRMGRSEQRSL